MNGHFQYNGPLALASALALPLACPVLLALSSASLLQVTECVASTSHTSQGDWHQGPAAHRVNGIIATIAICIAITICISIATGIGVAIVIHIATGQG